jgi:uncharacterized protein with FMN-binding domain
LSAVIAAAVGVIGLVGLKIPYSDVRDPDLAAPGPVEPSPTTDRPPTPAPDATPEGTSGPDPSRQPSPGPATQTTPAEPETRTVAGSREPAADYGYVQVQVTIDGSRLTEIILLEVTSSPRKAVREAPAILIEEALAAQSADIDNVSGATYTSEAFKESLRSALEDA